MKKNLTYNEAVEIYMKRAKELEENFSKLKALVKKLIRKFKEDTEISDRNKESKELAELEKELDA